MPDFNLKALTGGANLLDLVFMHARTHPSELFMLDGE
jgi:hypothetical protein